MNIFMSIFSPQNRYLGRFQAREKPNFIRKKIISPVLERENLPQRSVLTLSYNKQTILMPPVKKPLSLSVNKINTGRQRFLKDKPQIEKVIVKQERESHPNKEDTAVISQNKTKPVKQQQPLKERIKMYEIQLDRGRDWGRDWSNVDIISSAPLCRSTKYLQKYGCLHTDPVSNRWRV